MCDTSGVLRQARCDRENAVYRWTGGFTLIELVVTLLVLGVLLGAGVPWLADTLADWRARSAAERMLQDVQWAQAQAAAHNQKLVLEIGGAACGSSEWSVLRPGGQVTHCMSAADFGQQFRGVRLLPSVTGPVTISVLGQVSPQFSVQFVVPSGQAPSAWVLSLTAGGRSEIIRS